MKDACFENRKVLPDQRIRVVSSKYRPLSSSYRKQILAQQNFLIELLALPMT